MENPIEMDDLGVPLFLEAPMLKKRRGDPKPLTRPGMILQAGGISC